MSRASTVTLFDKYYYSQPDFIDGTTEFHALCASACAGARSLLEIGAGPSNETSRFLATVAPVIGLDISPEATANDAVTKTLVYDGRRFPFEDGSIDACVSSFVLEHVEHPPEHFAEVARVLRPGGVYVFRAPNLYHYVYLASRLTPHWVHLLLAKRLRGMSSEDHDPWPTFYRSNTPRTVRCLAQLSGLEVSELRMLEKEPSYARLGKLTFYPMMLYERLVNATPYTAPLRAVMLVTLRKS
jgi:SAM-dependent methyltransferase